MKKPNIILITVDCLRYDHLGCYGYHRNTSPNIDALAARGLKFLQAISNGGHTQTSFPAIMASVLPPLERDSAKTILQRSVTLAELLRGSGYHTAAFHSNPQLSHLCGYGKGFDVFDDNFHQSSRFRFRLKIRAVAHSIVRRAPRSLVAKMVDKVSFIMGPILSRVAYRPIVRAEEITKKAITWVKNNDGRFFLWLHYMDVHFPYLPEAIYLSQISDCLVDHRQMKAISKKMLDFPHKISQSEAKTIIDLYDADIKYTDDMIGLLLDRLGNQLDNTIVVVTADHGDELGEHGIFGHRTVYEGLLRVPLIMAGPGIPSRTSVKQQIGLIDLVPTITDVVGINSVHSFKGRSLRAMMKGKEEAILSTISTVICPKLGQRKIAYRIPAWKYIRNELLVGDLLSEEVYCLANDPGETKNLHGTDNDEANKFELEVRKKITQFKQLKAEEKTAYERQRIRAKLDKLGKL